MSDALEQPLTPAELDELERLCWGTVVPLRPADYPAQVARLIREVRQARGLYALVRSLAERVAAQSELLSRRAERT
jgi:hypothetical protein